MKNLISILILMASAMLWNFVQAQDIIYFKNGDEMKVKVLSIDENKVITYKKWDYLQGPEYKMKSTDVLMIIYENGTKEMFVKAEQFDNPEETEKNEPFKAEMKVVQNRSAGFITLGLTGAFALGDYASTDIDDVQSQYAGPGLGVKLDFGYNYGRKKIFGNIATLAFIHSWGNESALAENADIFGSDASFGYSNTFFVTGTTFSAWPTNKVAIDFNIQPIGMVFSKQKEISITNNWYGNTTIDQASSVGRAMKLGIASRVMIKEHLVFTGYFDFMYGHVTFENVAKRINGSLSGYDNYILKPMMLTFGVGLGYAF